VLSWTTPGSSKEQTMWSHDDGLTGYQRDLPRSKHYRQKYGSGGFYYVKHGRGYTYSWAADIWGVGIQAETDHSTDTWQEDDWGSSCRSPDRITGKNDCWHWAWGSNETASVAHTPKIFYNY
jgi:hypothetical protein